MQGTKCSRLAHPSTKVLRDLNYCTRLAIRQADEPANNHFGLNTLCTHMSGSNLLVFTLNLNLLQGTKMYNALNEFVRLIWICHRNT